MANRVERGVGMTGRRSVQNQEVVLKHALIHLFGIVARDVPMKKECEERHHSP